MKTNNTQIDLSQYLPADLLDMSWIFKDSITIHDNPGPPAAIKVDINLPKELTKFVNGAADYLALWALGRVLDGGSKIIRPSLELCRAMSEVDIHIHLSEYAQPYEGVAIVIPAGVFDARERLVISGFQRKAGLFFFSVDKSAKNSSLFYHSMPLSYPGTIEETLAIYRPTDVERTGLELDGKEEQELARTVRIAVNLCLFACERGYTLTDQTRPAKAKTDRIARLTARQTQEITIQDLDLIIKACRGPASYGSGTGTSKRFHRRRGHWRSQACGPNWSLRKRIFVESMLINFDPETSRRLDTVLR